MLTVAREYRFEAAHHLPLVPEGHKCKRMHGHNYRLEVVLNGPLERGWIMDFWDMDEIVKPLLDIVDHRCLNDIPDLENPTAEMITHWFFERVDKELQKLDNGVSIVACTVWEIDGSRATMDRK